MRIWARVPVFFKHRQVAQILSVDEQVVRDLIATGRLRERKILTEARIFEADLVTFLKEFTEKDE